MENVDLLGFLSKNRGSIPYKFLVVLPYSQKFMCYVCTYFQIISSIVCVFWISPEIYTLYSRNDESSFQKTTSHFLIFDIPPNGKCRGLRPESQIILIEIQKRTNYLKWSFTRLLVITLHMYLVRVRAQLPKYFKQYIYYLAILLTSCDPLRGQGTLWFQKCRT